MTLPGHRQRGRYRERSPRDNPGETSREAQPAISDRVRKASPLLDLIRTYVLTVKSLHLRVDSLIFRSRAQTRTRADSLQRLQLNEQPRKGRRQNEEESKNGDSNENLAFGQRQPDLP